jgi:hypothetical protein
MRFSTKGMSMSMVNGLVRAWRFLFFGLSFFYYFPSSVAACCFMRGSYSCKLVLGAGAGHLGERSSMQECQIGFGDGCY